MDPIFQNCGNGSACLVYPGNKAINFGSTVHQGFIFFNSDYNIQTIIPLLLFTEIFAILPLKSQLTPTPPYTSFVMMKSAMSGLSTTSLPLPMAVPLVSTS